MLWSQTSSGVQPPQPKARAVKPDGSNKPERKSITSPPLPHCIAAIPTGHAARVGCPRGTGATRSSPGRRTSLPGFIFRMHFAGTQVRQAIEGRISLFNEKMVDHLRKRRLLASRSSSCPASWGGGGTVRSPKRGRPGKGAARISVDRFGNGRGKGLQSRLSLPSIGLLGSSFDLFHPDGEIFDGHSIGH